MVFGEGAANSLFLLRLLSVGPREGKHEKKGENGGKRKKNEKAKKKGKGKKKTA